MLWLFYLLSSQNFGGGMRPPHNTMGPGMPGVNMWAPFKFVRMYFNYKVIEPIYSV